MFARHLTYRNGSVILFGPRGTGKSTWIKKTFKEATYYDLLNTNEVLRLSRKPSTIFDELQSLPEGSVVVIDEIQKVPELLNEVHRLIEDKKLKFILSGSSARKLKKDGTNLLAGRAILSHMFPLTSAEVNFQFDIHRAVQFGMLPVAFTATDPIPYLRTYAELYLQEEIKNEALTRNIGHFSRFLEIAARQNAQVTNTSGISRDAMVARQTVQCYFDILNDTLLGFWLRPWKLKQSTKQVAHPKFYFFDSGIVRALSGRLPYPPTSEEMGHLLETFILNEIRAYCSYSNINYPIYFWQSHGGIEVDIFLETRDGFVALEIKASERWDSSFNKGFRRMNDESAHIKCYGIYMGDRETLADNRIPILPAMAFLKKLWEGDIIRA